MILFPFYQDIEDKKFLVVGGGYTAAGKVGRLLQFTENIRVISPQFSEPEKFARVTMVQKRFDESDLEGADVVFAATNDHALNMKIAALCKCRDLPVNVVDDPDACTFYMPSLVKRGQVTVSITTGGSSPAYAKLLRQQIEDLIPEDIDQIMEDMKQLREKLKDEVTDQKERSRILRDELAGRLTD